MNLDPSLDADSPLDLKVKSALVTDLLHVVGPSAPSAEAMRRAAARRRPPPRRASSDAATSTIAAKIAALGSRASFATATSEEASGEGDESEEEASQGDAKPVAKPTRSRGEGAAAAAEVEPAAAEAAATAAATAAAAAAAVRASATDPSALAELSDMELWTLAIVDAEYERSKAAGGWRRLLPCAQSSSYLAYIEPARVRRNSLPFDVSAPPTPPYALPPTGLDGAIDLAAFGQHTLNAEEKADPLLQAETGGTAEAEAESDYGDLDLLVVNEYSDDEEYAEAAGEGMTPRRRTWPPYRGAITADRVASRTLLGTANAAEVVAGGADFERLAAEVRQREEEAAYMLALATQAKSLALSTGEPAKPDGLKAAVKAPIGRPVAAAGRTAGANGASPAPAVPTGGGERRRSLLGALTGRFSSKAGAGAKQTTARAAAPMVADLDPMEA